MVGLTILKAMFGDSDERLIERWVENPYWQYFCGDTAATSKSNKVKISIS